MGRKVRDSRLESREARLKLISRNEPYWRLIHEGLHLGYRKGQRTGTWVVRIFDSNKDGYVRESIGMADDITDSDHHNILTFKEAQIKAIEHAHTFHLPFNKPFTVLEASQHYLKWYKEHRKAYLETSTCIDAHILPVFGCKNIADITTKEIKEWHQKLAETSARKRSSKRSEQQYREQPITADAKRSRRSSANRILTVLKAILNKAYHDELVADNSAWRRVKPFSNVDEPIVRFLKEDECKRLINASQADFREIVKAALLTGARYGELTHLKVEDVSIDNRIIFIRPSKSNKGRHIPLSNEGVNFFMNSIVGKLGSDLVFTKFNGLVWGKSHQTRLLKRACLTAKIDPVISFHELRHTYASLLAQRGADLLSISKLLGHADTRITSRHYAHLCDKTLANTVNNLLPDFGHKSSPKLAELKI